MLSRSLSRFLVALVCLSVPAALHAQDEVGPDIATGPTYTESVVTLLTGNTGAAPGSRPQFANMIQASDGNFYGTTQFGGASGEGTVFQLTPAGVYTVLHSFTSGATDGAAPYAGVIQATDGFLYGTTEYGGPQNIGVLYQMQIGAPNTPVILHYFVGGQTDGQSPFGALVQATDGYLYGTTPAGGAGLAGTVFQIPTGTSGTFTIVYSFKGGAADGNNPQSTLIQATDGYLYGTTHTGGSTGGGTVFKVHPGAPNQDVILYLFKTGTTYLQSPDAPLVQASDGALYGTAYQGGPAGLGGIFKIQPGTANTPVYMHFFGGGTTDGSQPHSGLVEATDGSLYGTTYAGGVNALGTVYKILTGAANVPSILYSFAGGNTNGKNPYSGLIQATNGGLYGTTYGGGGFMNNGVLYELAASPVMTAPVQLTVPASVLVGASFSLSYLVANAYDGNQPGTLNYCFATNTAADTTGWTGVLTGEPTLKTATLTAPETAGTYTYALACGGSETGVATLNVTAPLTQLTFSSVTHNFGSLTVGSSAVFGLTITNTGVVPVSGSGITITGSAEFSSVTNCPASLPVGAHCQVNFTFAPTAAGSVSATWQVSGTGTGTTFVPSNGGTLSGSGTAVTGSVTLTSNGHNWGTVAVGTTSGTFGVVLTNATASSLTLTLGSVTAPFASATNCPATITAGASCNLQYTFTPSTTSVVQQIYSISADGGLVPITANGVASTGITLTGN